MIIDNFITVVNKLLAPSPVIINIDKLETVRKLGDFKESSKNYESLREIYNKPIVSSHHESHFKTYLMYAGGFILMVLFGILFFNFFGGGGPDKGKGIDMSHLQTPNNPFVDQRPSTGSLIGRGSENLSNFKSYFRSPGTTPGSPPSPSPTGGNTSQLVDSPEVKPIIYQEVEPSIWYQVMTWMGVRRDVPFQPGEGEAVEVEIGPLPEPNEEVIEDVAGYVSANLEAVNTNYETVNVMHFGDPYIAVRESLPTTDRVYQAAQFNPDNDPYFNAWSAIIEDKDQRVVEDLINKLEAKSVTDSVPSLIDDSTTNTLSDTDSLIDCD